MVKKQTLPPVLTKWQALLEYFKNPLSFTGFAVGLVTGLFHLALFLMDLSRGLFNPYLNIWFHLVLPPLVVIGFLLAFYGAWRKMRAYRKSGRRIQRTTWAVYPKKGVVVVGTAVAILLLPFLAVTSYSGYRYTDSVQFCGETCHAPMHAVYTAYKSSPHARVPCSECHIGEGASWFVRSKLSGTRQVFATLLDTYHRPIETPIRNLRPARETCEHCHWPEKNFGWKMVEIPHYSCDEGNTHRPLSMVLKTGGGDPELAPVKGIHWHIAATQRTEYVAVDRQRLEIPWVRVTTPEGTKTFRSDGRPGTAPPPEGERRTMDCLDCHNRPSHNYRTPDEILNHLFALGVLDPSLPFLKREATRLMARSYTTSAEAEKAISEGLRAFYEKNHPDLAARKRALMDRNIQAVLLGYSRNIFPEMKADWRTHPDHIGHKYYPGCFRCHDGRHEAADGTVIEQRCDLCHEFMEQKPEGNQQTLVPAGFKHPFHLPKSHEGVACYRCHDGGPTPPPTCAGCHEEIRSFMAGTLEILPGMTGNAHPHLEELECTDCHEDAERIRPEGIEALCMDCHEDEFAQRIRPALEEVRRLMDALPRNRSSAARKGGADTPGSVMNAKERARSLFERVRAIHNPAYAREILQRMERK